MPTQMQHSIDIARSPAEVYAFITQPWHWHHWHPSSKSARAQVGELRVGDSFDEEIVVQPLAPLPLTLHRETHYQVLAAAPAQHWLCRGQMRDGWLEIRYQLQPCVAGTRLTRTLTFDVRGLTRLSLPLLRRRQRQLSPLALANLKALLEAR